MAVRQQAYSPHKTATKYMPTPSMESSNVNLYHLNHTHSAQIMVALIEKTLCILKNCIVVGGRKILHEHLKTLLLLL